MPHERLKPSFTFTEDRLNELKKIVPEAFGDGKINWDALREALGENLEEEGKEHYAFTWPGKREAKKIAARPPQGTLVPAMGEGINEDTTDNIFIEGDNLEVLKLLQKSYAGKIKMIYIDPPYNTGNDFIYKDNFTQPLDEYLKITGQIDAEGVAQTTNKRADGRFHTNWLNMIYPRLSLARNLLRDDGVICISIDDVEAKNLRRICDEIFGEENFIEQVVWKNKYGSGALTKGFANVHEYILVYSRTPILNIAAPLNEEQKEGYKSKDSKFPIRGGYITQPLATTSKDDRPNLRYPIFHNGEEIWPEKQWIWSKERFEQAYANDEIVINEKNGKFSVRAKQYLKDENGIERLGKPLSILNGPFNQEGTKEIDELFGKAVFDFPKPSDLIKYLFSFVINDSPEDNAIYLDFFSGSAASAHALMKLNRERGGCRKFIMVQLPEPIDESSEAFKAGYKTIAQIGKDRIRRVIKKMEEEDKATHKTRLSTLPGVETFKTPSQNLGVKVFKLSPSNFKLWNDYDGHDLFELTNRLQEVKDPLVSGWKKEALLTEVMLQKGFPLDSKTSRVRDIKANDVMEVSSSFCGHKLFVCLDKKIEKETIAALSLNEKDVFVCLDSALTDEQKVRLSDKGFLSTI